jgi:hypothetical protein
MASNDHMIRLARAASDKVTVQGSGSTVRVTTLF